MVLSSYSTCENGLKVAIKPCYDSNRATAYIASFPPYSYSYSYSSSFPDVTQHWQEVL